MLYGSNIHEDKQSIYVVLLLISGLKRQDDQKCLSSAEQTLFPTSPGTVPDSKVHGANMGSIWGRQDPGGPHVGPMNLAIWGQTQWSLTHYVVLWVMEWEVSHKGTGVCFNIKTVFPGMVILIIKIMSWDRLIFKTGNPILIRQCFILRWPLLSKWLRYAILTQPYPVMC